MRVVLYPVFAFKFVPDVVEVEYSFQQYSRVIPVNYFDYSVYVHDINSENIQDVCFKHVKCAIR